MKNTINRTDFTFKQTGCGIYRVTFYNKLGKWWERDITDMELIDAVKNTPEPTKAAMNRLKRAVKSYSPIKGNLFASKKQKPTYKLSTMQGESGYLREELDWFLEQHGLTFVAGHKRYSFPTNLDIDFNSFDNWESVEKHLSKQGYKHIQPVYMYEHGMTAFSLNKFSCRFDSGQLGFMASTKKGRKAQKAFKLYGEFLKDLQDYSNNNVYYLELTDGNGEQIEAIECFENELIKHKKWLKKTYKNAKIIEIE